MSIRSLSRPRFEALLYRRLPWSEMIIEEKEWWSNETETVIGFMALDRTDHDFSWVTLGRDETGVFRALDLRVSFPERRGCARESPRTPRGTLGHQRSGIRAGRYAQHPAHARLALGDPILLRSFMYFDWTPDPVKLSTVFGLMPDRGDMTGKIRRKFRDCSIKEGPVPFPRLTAELPALEQIDLDLFYRPGNSNIRYWGSLDLNIDRLSGYIRVFGDYESFSKVFARFIAELGLTKTRNQLLRERMEGWQRSIDAKLFDHISGALRAGNFGSAFSSAVVYVEDRLRSKLGSHGAGLTGTELVQVAYKIPGVLSPPLSHANNSEDNHDARLDGSRSKPAWSLGQRAHVARRGRCTACGDELHPLGHRELEVEILITAYG